MIDGNFNGRKTSLCYLVRDGRYLILHRTKKEHDENVEIVDSKGISQFQLRVYRELLNVPHGATVTYGELAKRIGCKSAQAVGQALRRNPFAPEIPCHRVLAADGSLHGYCGRTDSAALAKKRRLLDAERVHR